VQIVASTQGSPDIMLRSKLSYSSNPGIISFKCSTTASGPFSFWYPYGIAKVLIFGTMLLAVARISADSPGVHIDAQN
jgi:hypothetical protein